MSWWFAPQTALHGRVVHSRRVRVLAEAIVPLIPLPCRIIDLGCGDGLLAAHVAARAQGLAVEGYDVLVRAHTFVPVHPFDGELLPLESCSVDGVLLIDVLHHADDPLRLLREATRVARSFVIIKDHRTARPGASAILRFMDWVGNRGHDVALPSNYWAEAQWRTAWETLDLNVTHYATSLGLYPPPARFLFETGLHFLAKLTKQGH